jgi:3-hydroxyisobutyrate dehydrogenase-like beta-hydroxyacid dehydrogenase
MNTSDKHTDATGSQPPIKRIGVVGLGHMGGNFAHNLVADGYRVTVYDRNETQTVPFVALGATAASSMDDLANCEAVLTSLPDDKALIEVTLSKRRSSPCSRSWRHSLVHEHGQPGSVAWSRSRAQGRRSRLRVSARPWQSDLAHEQKLFVLAAGASLTSARISSVISGLGQRVFHLGEDTGAANLMKVAANALTALTLPSMGEVLALLRKGGMDSHTAFDVLTGSLFDGRVHKTYGGKIVDSRYSPPGMTVPLAVKDLRLALAEAEHMSVPMPATSLVHDRLVATVARGWAALDWSALGLLAETEAGLPESSTHSGRT